MTKKASKQPTSSLVSASIMKEIQSCRPLRLFIRKQKKKGNEENAFAMRSKFIQIGQEKQMKYFQKSVQKYLQLLDEKQIDEKTQIEAQLFDQVLTKKEQKTYFQWLNAPEKPANSAAWFYSQWLKENPTHSSKAWRNLSTEEKKSFVERYNGAQDEYTSNVKSFLENLPDRLQADYLTWIKPTKPEEKDGNVSSSEEISKRRKSVSESGKSLIDEHPKKLTRSLLNELHKCKPSEIYYDKKVSDDDKPTFSNVTARNNHVRMLFNQLSEKKRKKFVLKATKKWQEFLESNPSIVEEQVPTLHLLLSRNEDILHYFSSMGLPKRPPISALNLYNLERDSNPSQSFWNDLPQSVKDEYIKRVGKLKAEYQENFRNFVQKVIPSDYVRFEFFRNIKTATKDYQTATKDQPDEKLDDGQLKITQYLRKKVSIENKTNQDFQEIYQKLLATKLSNEQKALLESLSTIMSQWANEKPNQSSENSPSKKKLTKTDGKEVEIILLNGDKSNDASKSRKRDHSEPVVSKRSRKR